MFEEVPRTRRGLARLTARHVVLGPFVVGGGVLLAAVGGSVAVAATVITASSIHASDVPPHPIQPPVVAASTSPAAQPHQRPADRPGQPAATNGSSRASTPPSSRPAGSAPPSAVAGTPAELSPGPASVVPSGTGQPAVGQPSASPSNSTNGPAGNATIYVIGFNPTGQRLQYEYAWVSRGAGPNGSDLYRVASSRQYSAALAADLTITSGGRLCPPAGSRCSVDQLAAAAGTGFYAIAAIDPADRLHSILEVDNAGTGFAAQSSPTHSSPIQSSSPQPTAS